VISQPSPEDGCSILDGPSWHFLVAGHDDFIGRSVNFLREGGVFVEIGKRGIWTPEQMKQRRPDIQYKVGPWKLGFGHILWWKITEMAKNRKYRM